MLKKIKKNCLYLPTPWLKKWKAQGIADPVDYLLYDLKGTIFRQQAGRKTLRFVQNGNAYFIKIHTNNTFFACLKEWLKNFLTLKKPITSANNELQAILALADYPFVPTITGYGFRTRLLQSQSFIITRALQHTQSLEDFCQSWSLHPPEPALKCALIIKVAQIAKIIHQHGINHRDFYLCHFLLDTRKINTTNLMITVIDWHRAGIRKNLPLRWRIKDIASLYFSAMDIGLTTADLALFMKIYDFHHAKFWQKVTHRAVKLYQKIHSRTPHVCT